MALQIRNIRNKDKPLMRRKSDLVEDTGTVRALMEHKRADEYLSTPPNENSKICHIYYKKKTRKIPGVILKTHK
ncbi:hypothetical protein Bhyg_15251 [Pseudolycoriella hygida]|uniref:Uncharacterized protein n=1 Tax=Pseudolycoriella hygida TaxID=35572 RepID=A0A9Q0MT41_9DIPT|nr:hypothetical protein Bhyg_15251 [Pseudolycoriella hygida]